MSSTTHWHDAGITSLNAAVRTYPLLMELFSEFDRTVL
jgi:hypothetical protein